MANKPWYQYGRIDNFNKYPDPEGAFPKPDSNVLCPNGSEITCIGSGVVTGVDQPGSHTQLSYGHVVTVILYGPHNDLATHDVYLHLADVAVSEGQLVGVNALIGHSGPKSPSGNASGAAVGFAFYPGDAYGRDDAWTKYYQGKTSLDPRLNPVQFLDAVKEWGPESALSKLLSGQVPTPGATDVGSNNPLTGAINSVNGVNDFFSNVGNFFSNPYRIVKIVLGILLIIAGGVLAIQSLKPVQEAEGVAAKAALAA